MKFHAALKLAAAALLTGALMVPAIGPAQAVESYPPHVSALYASPFMNSSGYAAVSVSGEFLTSGMTVRATRASSYTVAAVSVDPTGVIGAALVRVGKVLPTTAGRYGVDFSLMGTSSSSPIATTTQTYTVGKQISIKAFSVKRKSYGLYISGRAAKKTPVKITINFGSKTYTKKVYGSKKVGSFSYRFKKTTKGTYVVSASVAPNPKYFSETVSITYVRS